ncbi:MAG: DUF2252 domain-containing protein [Chthoniobacteraceae bacterium]|jgi:uncharacterized protein (DUF2252 family)
MSKPSFPSPADRRAHGKHIRNRLSRIDLGRWKPDPHRDVLAAVKATEEGRVPRLIPIKMARMAVSPFAFFRGAASLMARDLAKNPVTGLRVQICGDAHVKNLGAYAAPDGCLVFDLNDFDETLPGPWEWDLKRLAASVVLAGRASGDTAGDCASAVLELVRRYRESLDMFSKMKALDLAKYAIQRESENKVVNELLQKAERVTPAKTFRKLTGPVKDGWPRFHDQLPDLWHVPDRTRTVVFDSLKAYRETVTANRQLILDAYHPVDVAFKVVGTGSVGTRDYVILLLGKNVGDPMFLQLKEELKSCYAPWLDQRFKHQGRRAAEGQQRMQTAVDPFLGWATIEGRPFLTRQLADHKAAIDPANLKGETLLEYAVVCGTVLAKAHARTGDALALYGYCGDSEKLDKAIAKFAAIYADQTAADFEVFTKAIKAGKIKVAEG